MEGGGNSSDITSRSDDSRELGGEAVSELGGVMFEKALVFGIATTALAVAAMSSMLAVVMFLEARGVIDAGSYDEDKTFDIFSIESFSRR